MEEAFFRPLGPSRWSATYATASPWSPHLMHAGPPSALLIREIEREHLRDGWYLARVVVDILGPLPRDVVLVRSRMLRDGRSVALVEAELVAGDRPVLRATAWASRAQDLDLPSGPPDGATVGAAQAVPFDSERFPGIHDGYISAMEMRVASGQVDAVGAAAVWMRQRPTLVPDEAPTGVQRVLTVADSGNGISNVLDPRRHMYVNTDLTVHLLREPAGEWVLLDAVTTVDPGGMGISASRLADERGFLGHGAQSLRVSRREAVAQVAGTQS